MLRKKLNIFIIHFLYKDKDKDKMFLTILEFVLCLNKLKFNTLQLLSETSNDVKDEIDKIQLSVRSRISNFNIPLTITTRYKIISLDFTMNNISEENLKNLLQLILQCNALKDLRLRTDARLSVPKRLRLTNLDLKNNNRLTLESPNETVQSANRLTLESPLETVLGKCNSLTSLDLSNNKFGDTGIKYLEQLQQLCQLDSLAILNLSEIQIGPLGAESLPSVLKKLSSLVLLDLSYNNIGPIGTQKLTLGLVSPQCSSLSHLNLSNNNIGPLGAKSLASVLHQCRSLTLLDLSSNRIGPVGAKKLAAMIPKCNVISHLYLECNYVGNTGAKSLDRAKSQCRSLKYIYYKDYKLY